MAAETAASRLAWRYFVHGARGPTIVGLLGILAVAVHVLLAGGAGGAAVLVVHALAWAAAGTVAWIASREHAVVSGAVRRARAAIDLLEESVVIVDAATHRVVYANEAAARMVGAPVRDVVGRRIWDAGPWPDLERIVELIEDVGAVDTLEHAGRRLRITATRVAWEGDRAWVLHARDVTERDEARRVLAERERRFRALAEDAPGVVYRIRLAPEPVVEYVSPKLQDVLGREPEEWHRDPAMLLRLARPEHRPSLDLTGPEHVYGEQGVNTISVQRSPGQWVWLDDHHSPEHDEHGTLVGVQGILIDATARWQTEQALDDALRSRAAAAEAMDRTARVERTFLQSMSHELRTPLTVAMGLGRTLVARRDQLSADQQVTLLERVVASIERLEDLLDQFLDFDSYARGGLAIERTLLRLDGLVAEVASQVDLQGRTLHQELELVMVQADRRRLEQTVDGLLRNAVRHTPPGTTVWLSVTADEHTARIVVEDDGLGVPSEVVGHVFAPFTQGPASHDAAQPGVGMGLAMARVAARLHGGDVQHEPRLPNGARFIVELPLDAEGVADEGAGAHVDEGAGEDPS